jgi:hypothetical protein
LQLAEVAIQLEVLEKKSSVMNRTGLTSNSGLKNTGAFDKQAGKDVKIFKNPDGSIRKPSLNVSTGGQNKDGTSGLSGNKSPGRSGLRKSPSGKSSNAGSPGIYPEGHVSLKQSLKHSPSPSNRSLIDPSSII